MVPSNCGTCKFRYTFVTILYPWKHISPHPYHGKALILCHVVDELVLSAVVGLEVVVHVTKPVELDSILNQSLVAKLLLFQTFVVVVTTEPKVELESGNQGLEFLLCCNKSLWDVQPCIVVA
jgi:hypothetical protein